MTHVNSETIKRKFDGQNLHNIISIVDSVLHFVTRLYLRGKPCDQWLIFVEPKSLQLELARSTTDLVIPPGDPEPVLKLVTLPTPEPPVQSLPGYLITPEGIFPDENQARLSVSDQEVSQLTVAEGLSLSSIDDLSPTENEEPLVAETGSSNSTKPSGSIEKLEKLPISSFTSANGQMILRVKDKVAYYADWRLVQILHGIRAVLLVLIDASVLCCRGPTGPDSEFIPNLPAWNVIDAILIMRKWSQSDFVPNVKYWKDWPLARFLRNPLPPCPTSWRLSTQHPLFSGELGQFYRRVATFDAKRPDAHIFFRVCFGISQSKRGFYQVPDSFIQSAFEKHASKMESGPKGSFSDDRYLNFIDIILKGFRCPRLLPSLARQEGSTRASFLTRRSQGGARQEIRSKIGKIHPEGLIRMIDTSDGTIEEKGLPPIDTDQWKDIAFSRGDELGPTFVASQVPIPYEGFFRDFDLGTDIPDSDNQISQAADDQVPYPPTTSTEIPDARVAEVLEPLKVRLITAMDATRSHLARPLQQSLWKYLRSLSPFKLIGQPISEDLLYDLLEKDAFLSNYLDAGFEFKGERKFVSGDYSAATDGLDIRLSKLILSRILNRLHPSERSLAPIFRQILLEQRLVYPKSSGISPIIQQNGQLMGSILSFPVLCIANMLTYLLSLTPLVQTLVLSGKLALDELPVLINGDDILFRATDEHYKDWLDVLPLVGFSPSVGKNFFHPRFFTVNSVPIEYTHLPKSRKDVWTSHDRLLVSDLSEFRRLFGNLQDMSLSEYRTYMALYQKFSDRESNFVEWSEVDSDEVQFKSIHIKPHEFFKIHGFLNVGLLTGQSKLTGRDALKTVPLSGWHYSSVHQALNPVYSHKRFLYYHKYSIQSQTKFGPYVLNIFAHPLLGGLGFTPVPGVVPRYSKFQKALANTLYHKHLDTYYGQSKDFETSRVLTISNVETQVGSILGHRKEVVTIVPYPSGVPLPEFVEHFVDKSPIYPTVLSRPILPVTSDMIPACRLTFQQLKEMTKGVLFSKRELSVSELREDDLMDYFPFIPVKLDPTIYGSLVSKDQPIGPGLTKKPLVMRPATGHIWIPERFIQEPPISDEIPSVSSIPELLLPSEHAPMILPSSYDDTWENMDLRIDTGINQVVLSTPTELHPNSIAFLHRQQVELEERTRESRKRRLAEQRFDQSLSDVPIARSFQ